MGLCADFDLARMLKSSIAVILLCASTGVTVAADEADHSKQMSPEEVIDYLEKVRRKTGEQERLLFISQRRSEQVARTVKRYQDELNDSKIRLARLSRKVSDNVAARRTLETELATTRGAIAGLAEQLRARVRAFYLRARLDLSDMPLVDTHKSGVGDAKASYFMLKVQEQDQEMIAQLEASEQKLDADFKALQALTSEGNVLAEQFAHEQQVLQSKLVEHRAILAEAARREKRLAITVKTLGSESARLEDLITSLTGGSLETVGQEEGETNKSNGFKAEETLIQSEIDTGSMVGYFRGSYDGSGIPTDYDMPIVGTIVQGFGVELGKDKAPALRSQGVEISTQGELPVTVRTVASGIVRFVGTLPQYGRVLIIDHGQRDFTLYGRVSRPLKALGAVVSSGDDIAVLESPSVKGSRSVGPLGSPNLYFEVRRGGVAVDPVTD